MKKATLTALNTFLAIGLTLPMIAAAELPHSERTGVSVDYSDLNIHSEAGARVLYARLRNASEAVCGVDSFRETGSLSIYTQAEQCFVSTLDKAVGRVDSETLQRLHNG